MEDEETGVEGLEDVRDFLGGLCERALKEDLLVGVEEDDTSLDELEDHIIAADMFEDALSDSHLLGSDV